MDEHTNCIVYIVYYKLLKPNKNQNFIFAFLRRFFTAA